MLLWRLNGSSEKDQTKMIEVKPVLALPEGFHLVGLDRIDGILTVTIVSTQLSPCCPLCGKTATRMHSCYTRHAADLPCGGQSVRLLIQARKYFCEETTCARKIFVERLTPFIDPRARVTRRLFQIVQVIGLATGGRLGVRVTDRLGIHTTRQTILRRIMALPPIPVGQVIELGIDDFSFKRGRTFGTLLVDLQSRRVLDVLPDRKAETAAAWMTVHPEIRLVSRDRGGDYAKAAASGAPQAQLCADRFHLLKNLGEALEGVLARHLAVRRTRLTEEEGPTPKLPAQPRCPPKMSPKEAELSQAKREERLALYQHVVALRKLDLSQEAIADRVGVGHATVSRWLRSDTFPEKQPRLRPTCLDPHLSYLAERWEAGCHNIAQLYRELVARGFTHSYHALHEQLVRLFPEGRKNPCTPASLPRPPVQAKHAVFLFLRRPEELETDECETLTQLRQLHPNSIKHMNSCSSSRTCSGPAQGRTLRGGLRRSERATFASSGVLWPEWNETKRRSQRV
jgi:transposase